MMRLLLSVLLSLPLSAQFTVYDPTNWGVNIQNVHQAIQTYQTLMQYKQMFEQAAAFVHNPAQFLAQAAAISQVALNVASTAGITTSQRAAQLQEMIRLQQRAMQEAQTIGVISHGNMAAIDQLARSMQDTSAELAAVQGQLQNEQRSLYYQQQRQYQDQGSLIAGWRLK